MKIQTKEYGFTLVELAIALMVIGLLIGGVLKGQELVNNARIVQTIRQIEGYKTALVIFNNTYGKLPGDLVTPGTRLPNCTTTPCSTPGNGDGKVSLPTEQNNFWLHLAVANMVNVIDTSQTTFIAMSPGSAIGGAYMNPYFDMVANKNAFALTQITDGGRTMTYANTLTPTQAAQIDRKLDDGKPNTGDVLAMGSSNCYNSSGYREELSTQECFLFIYYYK